MYMRGFAASVGWLAAYGADSAYCVGINDQCADHFLQAAVLLGGVFLGLGLCLGFRASSQTLVRVCFGRVDLQLLDDLSSV
jgi:hypothetical protein